jgi:hypothetical protein
MRVGKKKKTTPNLGSVHECNYELSIYILRAYATVYRYYNILYLRCTTTISMTAEFTGITGNFLWLCQNSVHRRGHNYPRNSFGIFGKMQRLEVVSGSHMHFLVSFSGSNQANPTQPVREH